MHLTELITQLFIVLIGLLLFFLVKNFWPKYFETKGANQATKEDIEEITELVENVKVRLLQETEILKAQVSLSNQHLLNVKTAEREALIDLNKKVSAWFFYLARFELTSYNKDNFAEMLRERREFNKRHYEYDLAQAHLTLFMHDKAVLELIRDHSLAILRFERRLGSAILELKYMFQRLNIRLNNSTADRQIVEEEHHKEFMRFYDTFSKENLELYEIASNTHAALIKVLHKRIKELEY